MEDYNESMAVEKALSVLPPIYAVGTNWFAYENGVWKPTTYHIYRPDVRSILPEKFRKQSKISVILKHIESIHQISDSAFKSFYTTSGNAILINVKNGMVKVEGNSAILVPHDKNLNFTRQVDASYNPSATCPIFHRTVGEALPDELDRRLLQLFIGSTLLPSSKFEATLFCYGPTGNGKSTVSEAALSFFNNTLIEHISMANLCNKNGYYTPLLKDVAVNLGTELDASAVGESGIYKTLVSGESMAARAIRGNPFTLTTTAKLMFLSNNLPSFKHGTEAELRRMRFLHFNQVLTHKDVNLKHDLIQERDGIFLWAIQGLIQLLQLKEMPHGGGSSSAVHERFAVRNDPFGRFIATRCRKNPDGYVLKSELKKSLLNFYKENGIPPVDDRLIVSKLLDSNPNLKETQPRLTGKKLRVINGIELI